MNEKMMKRAHLFLLILFLPAAIYLLAKRSFILFLLLALIVIIIKNQLKKIDIEGLKKLNK